MSNPTTPFSWQMPTATDLVTDLPADFEVFGQAVATSMADLLGGTSGQILAKNSNTDMDFVWIANDQGDITGVTAGTGISGGGTSGTVTVTNSMATEITAKADLIVGTGNAAFDNLPVGANGTVLTADSTVSPTGLKWATPAAGGAGPSFGVGLTTDQTIVASTWTKVAFDQEDWDTNTNYSSVNYRFTPTVAGYYQINFVIQTNGSTQGRIYKNGSEYMRIGATPNANEAINGTTLVYCNGSSDYIEAYVNSSSTTVYSTDAVCYFSGSMTRSA